MKCRSCEMEHSPLLDCGRAARIAEFHARTQKQVPVLLKARVEQDIMDGTAPVGTGSNKLVDLKLVGPAALKAVTDSLVATKHGKYKDDEARKLKMREYMRKRREAAKKAKG